MFDLFEHEFDFSEEEFRLIRDFIHETLGLFFDDGARPVLRARLAPRLSSLDLKSFEEYYHYLRFGPQRTQELERIASHLTNNETYFFREPTQLNVLTQHVLPELKERKSSTGDRRLRILSAGCSSGEEAYTIAMLLVDSGRFVWNWDMQIVGMDVDAVALDKARKAVFYHNSFRATEPSLVERHFAPAGSGRRIKEVLRRMVTLRLGNILDPASYEDIGSFDIILCRNVFIYFSDSSILKATRFFFEKLAPGGYLFLGHAESLARITSIFTPIRFRGALIYQKPIGSDKP
jgi:chemotaxis protein methyltransferase CheR